MRLDDRERAVAEAPEAAGPAFRLCLALLEAKDPRAAGLVGDLLARFPDAAEGWDEVGQALLRAGKPEAAQIAFARALQAEPTLKRALRSADASRAAGRLEQAAAHYRQALAIEPLAARAWFGLGLCAQDLGQPAEAVNAYRRAAALAPTLAEAEVNLGTVLQDAGDLEGAKAAYGRALAIRGDTFGRIAQALTAAPTGELWLDLGGLRRALGR